MLHHAGEKEFTMTKSIGLYEARHAQVVWLAQLRDKYNMGTSINDRLEMRDFAVKDTVLCFMDGDAGSEYGVIHGRVSREAIGHSMKAFGRGEHGTDYVLMEISPYQNGQYEYILLACTLVDAVNKLPRIRVV